MVDGDGPALKPGSAALRGINCVFSLLKVSLVGPKAQMKWMAWGVRGLGAGGWSGVVAGGGWRLTGLRVRSVPKLSHAFLGGFHC